MPMDEFNALRDLVREMLARQKQGKDNASGPMLTDRTGTAESQ